MFISNAYAQAAVPAPTSMSLLDMAPLLLMFVILYFLMIRPQLKRAKDQKTMMAALQKGDEVVTQGGIAGKITKVGENYINVEIANNTEVVVQKNSIQTLLPKGSLKNL